MFASAAAACCAASGDTAAATPSLRLLSPGEWFSLVTHRFQSGDSSSVPPSGDGVPQTSLESSIWDICCFHGSKSSGDCALTLGLSLSANSVGSMGHEPLKMEPPCIQCRQNSMPAFV